MVDSFFIDPSAKKRKRAGVNRRTATAPRKAAAPEPASPDLADDEITSDSDMSVDDVTESESEDEFAHETEADKRRRLAKDYLENLQEELAGDGFDAKDLDRDIIARRLKEDVAEQEGKVYRYLDQQYSWTRLGRDDGTVRTHKVKPYGMTSVALSYPFAYTTSKDLHLSKWDVSNPQSIKLVKFVRGDHREKKKERAWKEDPYPGHFDEITSVAANHDGSYVATGGKDRRIVIWTAETLSPIKILETKDRNGAVLGLVFRRNTNELYASCADLKVRTYNIDQLTQVETLFGHQDQVTDITALGLERCITVGSRDRTAMVWKINEESRLIFRGGDTKRAPGRVMEGSIDCVCMVDDQIFVTGSDNGSISLWSTNKKRPIYVQREAHGRDAPMETSTYTSETAVDELAKIGVPESNPRYITSIYAVPYSNVFFSGSWSGEIKVWKVSDDLRTFEALATIEGVPGVVNRIAVAEHGNKMTVVAAISKEMRLGRWIKGKGCKNGIATAVIYAK